MFRILEKRFALSEKGAKSLVKGIFFTILLNLSLMLPAVYMFSFLDSYLRKAFDSSVSISDGIWYYILLGLGFMVIMFVLAILHYRNAYTIVCEESANRRISLAEKLRRLPLAYFGEKNLSDLTSTIMEDATALEEIFSHAVPQLFASIISIVLISIGMFIFNWKLALALFWVVPLAGGLILFSKKFQQKENIALYNIKREVSEQVQEGLETVQEIKSYNQEDRYLKDLNKIIDGYENQLIKGELKIGALVNTCQSLLKLGLASVIIVGANLILSGNIDTFTYLIFLLISSRVYGPINDVFNHLAALLYLDVRINRINEMEAMPIQEGKTTFETDNYDIEFKNVDFSYEEDKSVIKNVSFTARQGEITALVGPSGGGKSTTAKLAARFWDIDSGKILLGGYDIGEIDPETLLENYSVVFQDVVLFNSSIMDNIRIGKSGARDEEVIQAAKLAQCDEFACKMPYGYDTIIGENGETLSGGERQRISI
ncbi:MAG: ABC transporter ATP-binding protein, partial [Peptoniphilaceae bacterium]